MDRAESAKEEFVTRRKDGSKFFAHVSDSLIQDAQGAGRDREVSTDITKRAEQALREQIEPRSRPENRPPGELGFRSARGRSALGGKMLVPTRRTAYSASPGDRTLSNHHAGATHP